MWYGRSIIQSASASQGRAPVTENGGGLCEKIVARACDARAMILYLGTARTVAELLCQVKDVRAILDVRGW